MISSSYLFSMVRLLVLFLLATGCSREIGASAGWKKAELGKRHLYEVVVSVEAEGDVHEIKGVFECVYIPPPLMPTSNPSGGLRRYVYSAAKRLPSGAALVFIDPTQHGCELDGKAFQRGVAKWRANEASIIRNKTTKLIWADNADDPKLLKVYFPEHYEQPNSEVRIIDISARPLLEGEVTDPRIDAPFIQGMIETDLRRGGAVKPGSWVSLTAVFVEEEGWRDSTRESAILAAIDETRESNESTSQPIRVEHVYLSGKYFGGYGKGEAEKYLQDFAKIAPLTLEDNRLILRRSAQLGLIHCRQALVEDDQVSTENGSLDLLATDGIYSDGRRITGAGRELFGTYYDPGSGRLTSFLSNCVTATDLINPSWGDRNHAK